MSQKDIILPFSEFDMDRILVDRDGINEVNLQRFEMQQLDAIVVEDLDRLVCVGYKDATPDEFWVRGHMPGMPLMPGVIMCEAAAQLASYFATRHHLLGDGAIGLGGLEGVRFRNVVLPGNRLVLMSQMTKVRRGRAHV